MGKVLEFKRRNSAVINSYDTKIHVDESDDAISAIINNTSLTVANRHWLLENLLMDMDDQLEAFRQELERAESRLNTLVNTAELEIAQAYHEYDARLGVMTRAVRKLTVASSPEPPPNRGADRTPRETDRHTTRH
jgi:hypothetical protein